MKTLKVDLGVNSYDILIGKGLIDEIGSYINSEGGKVFIITDSNVAPLYLDRVSNSVKSRGYSVASIILNAGESTKVFSTMPRIFSSMLAFKITRSDLVITLGGGVVGDLGGFVAATYLRGIDFVQVPTSLLAQVDSSVGGKVAVDLPEGKNLVGAFYQPKKVIIDTDTLKTLTDKYYKDGMAEVIKYGCIKDNKLFEKLEKIQSRDELFDNIDDIVYTCCDIKRKVVEVDEKDTGERILLNFGHTYGHAVEKAYNFSGYSHGEAVAIGMYYITCISVRLGQTEKGTAERIKKILINYGLPFECEMNESSLINLIGNDKKNFGNTLKVVLLEKIGKAVEYSTDGGYFLK